VSPIEMRMATLRAVARDVKSKDADKIRAWRRHLLSCRFLYIQLDALEDVWKHARQLREDVAQHSVALRLTALQAVYEFVHFRNRYERAHGKQPARALSEAYRAGINFADTSEEVTDSFVDMAVTIDNRMLRVERIGSVLLKADNEFGVNTPFDAITKLQVIVNKGRHEDRILWAVEWIYDMRAAGSTETISLRQLQGTQACAGKGLVDLLNFKFEMKEHLPHYLGQYILWPVVVRDNFMKVLSNHGAYRQACGFPKDGMDLTWRAGWPASAENAFQAWEAGRLLNNLACSQSRKA
jgi:hypothetical protein